MAFDKAKFLAASPAPETEVVNVPGFGDVTVRALTGDEYDRFEAACSAKGPDGKAEYKADRATLVRLSVIDPETGLHVFDDADIPALRAEPAKVLIPISKAAYRLCGVGGDDAGN